MFFAVLNGKDIKTDHIVLFFKKHLFLPVFGRAPLAAYAG